ncbi:NADPH dehydrogenase NamA [Botryobacter ruber]|uniref:NADPH dehydrogenase NamA n=1 Tax=Botryobacter ruber TaxID=2171629 RepID=UPI000E0CAA9A|nr:NADPH dehydrogenase NamA [Botryobacter ruber]
MKALFSPLQLRSITLKNRIAVSPMCMYSSKDGFANDWHLVHLGSRAVGGAGLVLMEATAVSPEGRISPGDLGIWDDAHIPDLQRITTFIEGQQCVPGIQLAHAGRKASRRSPWNGGSALTAEEEGGWQTVAPSAVPFMEAEPTPHALTTTEIQAIVAAFAAAAQRALAAGFKVVELHAAHGYLLHEFLSPLSNQRTDEYGGSFENRVRFVLQITEAVRTVWPEELPLFVRVSATDWTEGGWTPEETVALAALLQERGVDLLDCSTGGNVAKAPIPVGPGYQVPFAEKVKKETGMRTGAVGMITDVQQAETIIASGQADLVLLAREMLRNPYFPLNAALELGEDIPWPVQYERAKPH